jgi:GNAT superfamily N-acetyltransferase
MITYQTGQAITAEQFLAVLNESRLAERRPVQDAPCIQGMLDHANLLATAWTDGRLIGVARSVTDFHYCCYLSDLAVSMDHQKRGVGRGLIEATRQQLGPRCSLILLSAPAAVDYYPKLGFQHHPQAWMLAGSQALNPA